MPEFCPKCGNILVYRKINNEEFLVCTVCKFRVKLARPIKENTREVPPAEISIASNTSSRVIKDKSVRKKISIDEDLLKEARDRLAGASD
ncbi:MAG: hypothetical protein ACP6IQ_00025 [Candidatus Njordarchaeia archaeon]|nr:hypothetical protein [Candidatus Korarchaeota archaeon]